MTDDLLQYARAELSAQPSNLTSIDVRDAIDRAVRLEARSGVSTAVDVPPGLHVMANAEYLVRALANVLRNAVRYAGEAGPISIVARPMNRAVNITVRDCGPGVPPDMLERIFAPFARLDASRNRRSGGVGLGLAIVRSSIEACGGTVSCANCEPSGLEVRLSLRAANAVDVT